MGSQDSENTAKQELDDSGCVEDAPGGENGRNIPQLTDLSDDVLLCILQYLTPRDLKALGHTCSRLGALICDRTLWTRVDARAAPMGQERLSWLLTHCLSSATTELQISGYANKYSRCLGVQDMQGPVDADQDFIRGTCIGSQEGVDVEHFLLRMWYPHLPRFAVSPRWPDRVEAEIKTAKAEAEQKTKEATASNPEDDPNGDGSGDKSDKPGKAGQNSGGFGPNSNNPDNSGHGGFGGADFNAGIWGPSSSGFGLNSHNPDMSGQGFFGTSDFNAGNWGQSSGGFGPNSQNPGISGQGAFGASGQGAFGASGQGAFGASGQGAFGASGQGAFGASDFKAEPWGESSTGFDMPNVQNGGPYDVNGDDYESKMECKEDYPTVLRDPRDDCKGPQFTLTKKLMRDLKITCPNLTSLAVEYCNLDYRSTNLRHFPNQLKKLSLRGSRVYNLPLNTSYLGKVQERLPELEYLDVSECDWFEPASLMPLSKLVGLTELYMRDCKRLTECVAYASLATRYGFRKLRVFDVRGSPLADSEVSALGWLPRLEELYVSPPEDYSNQTEHKHSWSTSNAVHNELDDWEEEEPDYFKIKEPEPEYEPDDKDEEPDERHGDVMFSNPWWSQERRIIVIQPNANRQLEEHYPLMQRQPSNNAEEHLRVPPPQQGPRVPRGGDPLLDDLPEFAMPHDIHVCPGGGIPRCFRQFEPFEPPRSGPVTPKPVPTDPRDESLLRQGNGNGKASSSYQRPGPSNSGAQEAGPSNLQAGPAIYRPSSVNLHPVPPYPRPGPANPQPGTSNPRPGPSNPRQHAYLDAGPPIFRGSGSAHSITANLLSGLALYRPDPRNPQGGYPYPQAGYSNAQAGYYNPQPGYSNQRPSRANAQAGPSNAQAGPSNAQAGPSNAQPGPSYSQPGPSYSQPGPSYSQPGPSSSQPGPSNSQPGLSNAEKRRISINDAVDLAKRRRVEEDEEEMQLPINPNPAVPVHLPEQCPRLRMDDVENPEQPGSVRFRRQDPRPMMHVDVEAQRQPPSQIAAQIGAHVGYHLVSDSALLRFGRAENENVNYVHIGRNGIHHGSESGSRPDGSNLRILSVTGYRNITDRSLQHLVTAAPYLLHIDFSETNVTPGGVEMFRAIRPECEVIYSPFNLMS